MEANAGRRVAFASVADKIRNQLDCFLDDDDILMAFECVVEQGAESGPFIRDLLAFCQEFVDPKVHLMS